MDQRAHRGRAGHGVGQPDEQRNLRGFARGADEQQQGNQSDGRRTEHLDMLLQLEKVDRPDPVAA